VVGVIQKGHVAIALVVSTACGSGGHEVPDDVSCRTCEIQVTAEVVIGADDGPGSLVGRPTSLVTDGTGRFWVGMLDYNFPFIYSPNGVFEKQFGQPGEGPGEFRSAYVQATLPGDSMLLSAGLSYVVVGPDLNVHRTIARGPGGQLASLRVADWPARVLGLRIRAVNRVLSSHATILDFSGDRVVEGDSIAWLAGPGELVYRRVEPAPDGDVWVSDVTRYILRRYGSDGTVIDSVERRPAWFPDGQALGFGSPTQAPSTNVGGVRVDSAGLLWIFVDRPKPGWRDVWGNRPFPSSGEVRVSALPAEYELWNTTVEVIDVVQRRVVARTVLEGHVFSILRHDRVATYVELPSGIPKVTVHRLQLVR
jgi:hypothetical protein